MQRDYIGYGENPPVANWPLGAHVAISFVLNYEEGSENCLENNDGRSENLLSDIIGSASYKDQRHMNMESLYEYGSRAGFWRIHRLFKTRGIPLTVYANSLALEKNLEATRAMVAAGFEMASHGHRWFDYQNVPEETEREHLQEVSRIHRTLLDGQQPLGLYQGKPNERTLALTIEQGHYLYSNDCYADDLPYWIDTDKLQTRCRLQRSTSDKDRYFLMVPYTLEANDMKFVSPGAGFAHGEDFFIYLRDAVQVLADEARETGRPKMISIGLHNRLVGKPGRFAGLVKFIDWLYCNTQTVPALAPPPHPTSLHCTPCHSSSAAEKPRVWIAKRGEIAEVWYKHHWPGARKEDGAEVFEQKVKAAGGRKKAIGESLLDGAKL